MCVWGETLGFLVEYPGLPVDSCWSFPGLLGGTPEVPGGVP